MDEADPRKRALPLRPRDVGRNLVAVMAVDRNGFYRHAFVCHGRSFLGGWEMRDGERVTYGKSEAPARMRLRMPHSTPHRSPTSRPLAVPAESRAPARP